MLSVATSIRVIIIEVNYGGTRWLIIEFIESVGDSHVECGMQAGGANSTPVTIRSGSLHPGAKRLVTDLAQLVPCVSYSIAR